MASVAAREEISYTVSSFGTTIRIRIGDAANADSIRDMGTWSGD
jgi:hypothetical protein